MTDDIEEDAHSERGPSTAHRWRPCPASVRLSRGLPNTAGIEAAYGTVFHEVAALCLELAGDSDAASALDAYFDVFSQHYLGAKQQLDRNESTPAHAELQPFIRKPQADLAQ